MLLVIGLSNALVAAGLALAVAIVSRFCRHPALIHSLWIVVLLKLITPPLVTVPVPSSVLWQANPTRSEPAAVANVTREAVVEPATNSSAVAIPDNCDPFRPRRDTQRSGGANEASIAADPSMPAEPAFESPSDEFEPLTTTQN